MSVQQFGYARREIRGERIERAIREVRARVEHAAFAGIVGEISPPAFLEVEELALIEAPQPKKPQR